jgi:O-antigen/teichoic acid export membrane protein
MAPPVRAGTTTYETGASVAIHPPPFGVCGGYPRGRESGPLRAFDMTEQLKRPSRGRRGGAVAYSGLMSLVALVALGLTRLVHGSLVSRATDQDTYATVGTLIGVAMTAGLFLPAGLASAASKFIPYQLGRGDERAAWAVRRWLLRAGRAAALVLGAAAGLLAAALPDVSAPSAAWAALLTAAFSLYSVEKAVLYGFALVTTYVRLELTGSAIAIGSTAAVIVLGWHSYLLPLVLGYSVLQLGAWWVLGFKAPARTVAAVRVPPPELRREIIHFVGLASIGGLTSAGLLQCLPIVAGRFTEPLDVAYFVAGVALVTPLYLVPRALSLALFPALARSHGARDEEDVRWHTDVSTRALLVLLAPPFAAAMFLAPDVLSLFGGARYAGGALTLQLLLAATYVAVVQVGAVSALSSGDARSVRIPIWSSAIGCAVGLAVAVPLGWQLGGLGVALSYVLSQALSATGPLVAAWRRYRMTWHRPLALSMAVVGAAVAVALWADGLSASPTARVGMAAVGFAAGIGVLGRETLTVLRDATARRS